MSNTEPVSVITLRTVFNVIIFTRYYILQGGKIMSSVIVCGAFAAVLVAKWKFYSKMYAAK